MKKTIPTFSTDEQAERFVAEADLSEYDLSDFKETRFVLEGEMAQVEIELPKTLLDALKGKAKAEGVPYGRYIRELLERSL